jgi:hypothetical protein
LKFCCNRRRHKGPVRSTSFLPRHQLEVGGQLHTPAALPPVKKSLVNYWTRDCVGSRTHLNEVEKRKFFTLPRPEVLPIRHPARSQLICRLHPTGSPSYMVHHTVLSALLYEYTDCLCYPHTQLSWS